MGYLYALGGVYFQEMKHGLDLGSAGYILIYNVPIAVVLAWIAGRSSSPVPLDYLSVGVFLMAIWNWVAIRTGWALSFEFVIGTFDYTLTSRTPLMLVVFGRALARTTVGIPSGIVPFLVILVISQQFIEVANPALLLISLGVAIFSVLSVGLIFAPLFLLLRGREGFFNVVRPVGVVLAGFLYPVSFLSPEVEVIARFLPISWAMDTIIHSLEFEEVSRSAIYDLVIAAALSATFLAVTYLSIHRVERRIRLSGDLSYF